MGWIKERILSEYAKHGNRLDWAKLAEQKIIANITEDLKEIHQKTGIHIPLSTFALVATDEGVSNEKK